MLCVSHATYKCLKRMGNFFLTCELLYQIINIPSAVEQWKKIFQIIPHLKFGTCSVIAQYISTKRNIVATKNYLIRQG